MAAVDSESFHLNASAPVVAAETPLGRMVALVLFASLAGGLVLPKVAGAGFLLLAVTGLAWLSVRRAWLRPRISADEKLLVLAVCLYVGVWLFAWLVNGLDRAGLEGLGRTARLLLIIPVYFFIRRVDGLESAWWAGLTAGALIAGGYALWFVFTGQPGSFYYRVDGPTNPIYFGGIALAFGLMLLARVTDQDLNGRVRLLVVLAVALALAASALTASRGAWLAIPPLLVLYVFTLGSGQSLRWRLGVPAGLAAIALVAALTPAVPLGERFAEAATAFSSLRAGGLPEGTLGLRWEMWLLALDLIRESPFSGSGPGAFRAAIEQAVASGRLDPAYLEFRHPHSEYLSALVVAGVPGLAALLLLFGLPARRCALLCQTGLDRTRLLGWCGLTAMTVLAVMALSESILERNTGIIWFALLTAGAAGLVQSVRRQQLSGQAVVRIQSLSVIMICRNEADRIRAALESVSGWADEIVVLDSGSTDGTAEICRAYTDQVEVTDWPGFGPQKQRALDRASGDWVLSLDADEVVSEELKREIDLALAREHPRFDGYYLPWSIRAFGSHHQFGHWSRAPLRLFRRGAARFTPVAVHEKVAFMDAGSRAGRLEGPVYHDLFRDLKHAREKFSSYARLQARERFNAGRRVTLAGPWLRAAANFIDNFVFRAAFLDGRPGWTMAWLHAHYTFEKYQHLRRLNQTSA